MRHFILIWLVGLAAVLNGEELTIPDGVVYKASDAATNDRAKTLISEMMKGAVDEKITTLFCGPGLWSRAKNGITDKDIKFISTTFDVPNTTTGKSSALDAATFQNVAPIQSLLNELKDRGDKPVVIRKLDKNELKMHWAVISWDIEEPIFIAEQGEWRVLFEFSKDIKTGELALMFIDEMTAYSK